MSARSQSPLRRVRQACDRCRRKKTRCTAERPICSLCRRTKQSCCYTDGPATATAAKWAQRFELLERRLAAIPDHTEGDLIDASNLSTTKQNGSRRAGSGSGGHTVDPILSASSETRRHSPTGALRSAVTVPAPILLSDSALLPSPDVLLSLITLFIAKFDCQPLFLFDVASIRDNYASYDDEALLALVGYTLSFSPQASMYGTQTLTPDVYLRKARCLAMEKAVEGTVTLSTLQAICLLSHYDLVCGKVSRARALIGFGTQLSYSAGLNRSRRRLQNPTETNSSNRTFWSLHLLSLLASDSAHHPRSTDSITAARPSAVFKIPASFSSPVIATLSDTVSDTDDILTWVIEVTDIWRSVSYYLDHRHAEHIVPWLQESEHTRLRSRLDQFQFTLPDRHRFLDRNFLELDSAAFEANMDYWGPWIFLHSTFHMSQCLLHHPLLLTRHEHSKGDVPPRSFAFHCQEQGELHSSWVDTVLDAVMAKRIPVSDPFLAYIASVNATIHLFQRRCPPRTGPAGDNERYSRCIEFISTRMRQWPMAQRKLEQLATLQVSSESWGPSTGPDSLGTSVQTADVVLLEDLLRFVPIKDCDDENSQPYFVPSLSLRTGPHAQDQTSTLASSPSRESTDNNTAESSQMPGYGIQPLQRPDPVTSNGPNPVSWSLPQNEPITLSQLQGVRQYRQPTGDGTLEDPELFNWLYRGL